MKFKSNQTISHNALVNITHQAGLQISHAALQIQHSAQVKANVNGPLIKIQGFNKNLLLNPTSLLSNFKNFSGMLNQVKSALGGALGLQGIGSQLGSLTSSFSSLTSLAGNFGNITSLVGSLGSFTNLGSVLGGIVGDTGLMSTFQGSFEQLSGALSSLSGSSGSMSSLSNTSLMSSSSTNLSNLAAIPAGTSSQAIANVDKHMTTISTTLDAVSMLQDLGVQQSQPGSTVPVSELSSLMKDIYTLLSSPAFTAAIAGLSTESQNVMNNAAAIIPDIEAVLSNFPPGQS